MDEAFSRFPFAGVNVSCPFSKQPARNIGPGKSDYARSCAAATNVRGRGADGRRRGASRSGIARYINQKVNGVWIIQDLAVIVHVDEDAVS